LILEKLYIKKSIYSPDMKDFKQFVKENLSDGQPVNQEWSRATNITPVGSFDQFKRRKKMKKSKKPLPIDPRIKKELEPNPDQKI
jgi:hypothetical protein